MAPSQDHYQVLGIELNATDSDIKTAYRKLALKYHPDKNGGSAFAADQFIAIKQAQDILSNRVERQKYDKTRRPKKARVAKTTPVRKRNPSVGTTGIGAWGTPMPAPAPKSAPAPRPRDEVGEEFRERVSQTMRQDGYTYVQRQSNNSREPDTTQSARYPSTWSYTYNQCSSYAIPPVSVDPCVDDFQSMQATNNSRHQFRERFPFQYSTSPPNPACREQARPPPYTVPEDFFVPQRPPLDRKQDVLFVSLPADPALRLEAWRVQQRHQENIARMEQQYQQHRAAERTQQAEVANPARQAQYNVERTAAKCLNPQRLSSFNPGQHSCSYTSYRRPFATQSPEGHPDNPSPTAAQYVHPNTAYQQGSQSCQHYVPNNCSLPAQSQRFPPYASNQQPYMFQRQYAPPIATSAARAQCAPTQTTYLHPDLAQEHENMANKPSAGATLPESPDPLQAYPTSPEKIRKQPGSRINQRSSRGKSPGKTPRRKRGSKHLRKAMDESLTNPEYLAAQQKLFAEARIKFEIAEALGENSKPERPRRQMGSMPSQKESNGEETAQVWQPETLQAQQQLFEEAQIAGSTSNSEETALRTSTKVGDYLREGQAHQTQTADVAADDGARPDATYQEYSGSVFEPSEETLKRMLGEKLRSRVGSKQPELAGRITRLLLELDEPAIRTLICDDYALELKIDESVKMCCAFVEAPSKEDVDGDATIAKLSNEAVKTSKARSHSLERIQKKKIKPREGIKAAAMKGINFDNASETERRKKKASVTIEIPSLPRQHHRGTWSDPEDLIEVEY